MDCSTCIIFILGHEGNDFNRLSLQQVARYESIAWSGCVKTSVFDLGKMVTHWKSEFSNFHGFVSTRPSRLGDRQRGTKMTEDQETPWQYNRSTCNAQREEKTTSQKGGVQRPTSSFSSYLECRKFKQQNNWKEKNPNFMKTWFPDSGRQTKCRHEQKWRLVAEQLKNPKRKPGAGRRGWVL